MVKQNLKNCKNKTMAQNCFEKLQYFSTIFGSLRDVQQIGGIDVHRQTSLTD